MSFWPSLAVEVIGGVVTAAALALVAGLYGGSALIRRHDAQVDDPREDNRRWFRDRHRQLGIATSQIAAEMAARGLNDSGIHTGAVLGVARQALAEYRDEMTIKRRRYRELRAAESGFHEWLCEQQGRPFPRFELTEEQKQMLTAWRKALAPPGTATEDPSDEPNLRRSEREGETAT